MVPRISPTETRSQVKTGQSLLVCAYGSDEQCKNIYLDGALLPSEFQSRVSSLSKDQEIIFYCA